MEKKLQHIDQVKLHQKNAKRNYLCAFWFGNGVILLFTYSSLIYVIWYNIYLDIGTVFQICTGICVCFISVNLIAVFHFNKYHRYSEELELLIELQENEKSKQAHKKTVYEYSEPGYEDLLCILVLCGQKFEWNQGLLYHKKMKPVLSKKVWLIVSSKKKFQCFIEKNEDKILQTKSGFVLTDSFIKNYIVYIFDSNKNIDFSWHLTAALRLIYIKKAFEI